ncbi:MAG: DeoR/GlpR family DNA-binding transcription regulator [Clostridia bacterium]
MQIVEYINRKRKANVSELSTHFRVSKVTIRKDLDELSLKGMILKTRGGAVSIYNSFSEEIPFNKKYHMNTEEKKRIGAKASEMVFDGDVIILDAGSTTLEVAKKILKKNVTVITNDLKVALEQTKSDTITLIVVGGIVEKTVYSMAGPEVESFLSRMHVNKTFLGADAIDIAYGITNRTLPEITVKKSMIKAADEVIVVSDHTKTDKRVFAFLCSVEDIDTLITDFIEEESKKQLEEKGVKVIVAKKNE